MKLTKQINLEIGKHQVFAALVTVATIATVAGIITIKAGRGR